jgi:flagellin-like hook-associated protein FlgL
MRISTATIYSQSLNAMMAQERAYQAAAQQVSNGQRVVNPSDDSLAASQAVNVRQATALNDQYAASRSSVESALAQEDSTLGSISKAISSAKNLLIQAGNGTLSDTDRTALAASLQGAYDTLATLANATDSNGSYLFSGYQSQSAPFVADSDGHMQYQGDLNDTQADMQQRIMQKVGSTQSIARGDSAASIFLSAGSSARYVAQTNTAPDSTLVFTGPDVIDNQDPGYNTPFSLSFGVDVDGNASYTLTNGDVVGTPVAYQPGTTIKVNGLSLNLSGVPADGDSVSVASSTRYVAQASLADASTLALTGPDVVDAKASAPFSLSFAVAADNSATYTITQADGTAGTPVPYVDGDPIKANGLSLSLSGQPVDGDSYSFSQASVGGADLFATLSSAISALSQPITNEADQAHLSNVLNTSGRQLDNALDNVLTVRTSVGSRMNQLEVLNTIGDDLELNYAQRLSDLVDVDLTEAIGDYTSKQVALQAAQQTFISLQKLSLFEYL